MKLGANAGIVGCYTEDRFLKLKEYGFDYFDLGIEGAHPRMTPEEYERYILHQKELADAAGVTIWQVHGPWRYPPHDETEERRAERLALMQNSLRLTAQIGCKYWVIHPIMPFGPDDDYDLDLFMKINYDFFQALLPTAKQYGITICFENMPMKGLSISTPEATLRFIRSIDDENFKFCLDTGHCSALGISPAEAVRMAGKDLKVLHVHDNGGRRDDHFVPLKGVIDWKDFGAALVEIGYDGVYSLECGWKEFLINASNETKLSCLRAIVDEVLPKEV